MTDKFIQKEQKFKRGNLVKILTGRISWSLKEGNQEVEPELIGRKAIIEGSYADLCGGNDTESYSIIFLDTGGSLAWKDESELELLDEGGEHLLEEAKRNSDELEAKHKRPDYIKKNISNLNSTSILYLFGLLGFKTSFFKNGEFFILFAEWQQSMPIFIHIMNSKSIKEAKKIFTEKGNQDFNVERVWQFFHKDIL